jgi:hypothetical protein
LAWITQATRFVTEGRADLTSSTWGHQSQDLAVFCVLFSVSAHEAAKGGGNAVAQQVQVTIPFGRAAGVCAAYAVKNEGRRWRNFQRARWIDARNRLPHSASNTTSYPFALIATPTDTGSCTYSPESWFNTTLDPKR